MQRKRERKIEIEKNGLVHAETKKIGKADDENYLHYFVMMRYF